MRNFPKFVWVFFYVPRVEKGTLKLYLFIFTYIWGKKNSISKYFNPPPPSLVVNWDYLMIKEKSFLKMNYFSFFLLISMFYEFSFFFEKIFFFLSGPTTLEILFFCVTMYNTWRKLKQWQTPEPSTVQAPEVQKKLHAL